MTTSKSKNAKLLKDFTSFCKKNPDMRFWQALNYWSGLPNLVVMSIDGKVARDTYYWEYKNK